MTPRVLAVLLAALPLAIPTRVTKVLDEYPVLSPDGARVVFQSDRSGNAEIYTMAADGTAVRRLTDTPYDEHSPVWSPDGKRILFAANPTGNGEDLFVMNADGRGTTRLTDAPGDDGHPHWSADGTLIVFNSARTTPDLTVAWSRQWHEIFTMKADGSGVRQITQCRSVCTYGALSPDGRRIAFRKVTSDPGFNWDMTLSARNSEVFVADADGSNELNVSRSAAYDGWPAWSPDGRRILFVSNRAGRPLVGELFVAAPDASSVQRISSSAESLVQPSWSADGRRIFAAQYTLDEEAASIVVLEAPEPRMQ